jgi:hypothetical protein
VPWLCAVWSGHPEITSGLWANTTRGVAECVRRLRTMTEYDPDERRGLRFALLEMWLLFRVGEACAPFTAELWGYRPTVAELAEDQAQSEAA